MKKVYWLICIALMTSIVSSNAQETAKKQIYKEELTISDDNNNLLAVIDIYGKVTLTENTKYDNVINQLCQRIMTIGVEYTENINKASDKIEQLNNVIDSANQRVIFTLNKISEIQQAWIPPKPEPKVEVKPEPKKRKKFLGIF